MKIRKPDISNWIVAGIMLFLAGLAGINGAKWTALVLVGAALYELLADQKVPYAYGGDGKMTQDSISKRK